MLVRPLSKFTEKVLDESDMIGQDRVFSDQNRSGRPGQHVLGLLAKISPTTHNSVVKGLPTR